MEKELTLQEIEELKSLQILNVKMLQDLGALKMESLFLERKQEALNIKFKEFADAEALMGQTLQNKYGNGQIDIEAGKIIIIE